MPIGTGYTNIQQYLAANKGNRLSDTLKTGIEDKANAAGNELTSQQNTFNTGMSAEQQRLDAAKNGAQGVVDKLSTTPGAIGNDDVNQYRSFQNATYTGPTGLQNEDAVKQKANLATSVGNLANSAGGRKELLRSFINRPDYTNGKQSFDNLLVGNDVDTKLREGKQTAQRIPGQLDSTLKGIQNRVTNTTNTLKNDETAIQGKTQGIGRDLQNTINKRLQDKQAEDASFRDAINSKDLSALKRFGLDPNTTETNQYNAANTYGQGSNYYNALITPTYASNITAGGLASDDEKAKATALGNLLNDSSYGQYTSGDKYTAESLAADPVRANSVAQGLYNKVTNEMTLPQLAAYHPELASIVKGWDDPNKFTLNSAIDLFKGYNNPSSVPDYQLLTSLANQIKSQFSNTISPSRGNPIAGDTGIIPQR